MARGNPYALEFNGTNSQVNIASNSALNFTQASKFTIEMWFKANSIGSNMTLFNKQRATTNEFVISVDVQADGYVLYAVGKQNVAPVNARSKNPIISGKWYHIAAISDGTNISLYLDGVIQESILISITGTTQSLANAIIGHWYFNATSYFNGQIDDFRIWNTNRSVDDVNKNKNSYLKGTESNLILLYRMNEGSGLTTIDSSPSNISGTLVNVTWTEGMVDMFGNTGRFLISSEDTTYSLYKVVGKPLIPLMDGYDNAVGSVIGSASYSTGYTWKAFDNDDTSAYGTNFIPDSSKPIYVGFRFNEPVCVKRYSFLAGLRTFKFMASNNGTTWDTLDTKTSLVSNTSTIQTFDIQNDKFYSYYKLEATLATSGNAWVSIFSVQFYGLMPSILLECPTSEGRYIRNGMDKGFQIDTVEELNVKQHIKEDSIPLDSGKVFRQPIDRSKHKVHKIILGK
ncbi:LamG domain-containing protein [Paenibacillus amylolyticus]|uniref:LamG domain-containing protein n=1 Tax=Paenibacillus amylolyticus TaxID=1451 RepID=UPI00344B97AA